MNALATAREEERQYGSLKKEIDRLSALIVSSKKRLERYQYDEAAHERIKAQLAEMTIERDELKQELSRMKSQKRADTRALERVQRDLAKAKYQYEEYSEYRKAQKMVCDRLEQRVHELEKRETDLLAGKRAGHKSTVSDISKREGALTDKLAALHQRITDATKAIKGMEADRKKADALKATITRQEKKVADLEADAQAAERDIKAAEQEAKETRDKTAEEREAFAASCAARTHELNERERALETREGDISVQKQQIREYRRSLKDVRIQLEKIHGEPIATVAIPEALDGEE